MRRALYIAIILASTSCSKSSNNTGVDTTFTYLSATINGVSNGTLDYTRTSTNPTIQLKFSAPLQTSSTTGSITLKETTGTAVTITTALTGGDSILVVKPTTALKSFTKYTLTVGTGLTAKPSGTLKSSVNLNLATAIDSSDKYPQLTDDQLLTKVQQQTFKYFWEFAHGTSGLARERNTSGDLVTSGGSGFGIMAIISGVSRGFITRAQGLERMQKIVGFLKTKAATYHGAFPHWLNGITGATIPFSAKDDGADLVETSLLMQGLLCARQYFNTADAAETTLRTDINTLWNNVEWSWFRKNNSNILYWHWSPNYNWDINLPIRGWNEALITYVLAASSTTYTIPKTTYDSGWAGNGAMKNSAAYYNIQLPLGPAYGGPLFLSHYSFLGINPNGLTDAYANYEQQTKNHTLINYNYSIANPKAYYGYSNQCWGLTASDVPGGYNASSPTNDVGVIAPTAALSSFPYTPTESMQALKFFYYKLGDKIWKDYGFIDAFSLHDQWFAESYLAIDQGPIIIMIENYRSGLLWNLFMSCPEVKAGMTKLGFQSPHI